MSGNVLSSSRQHPFNLKRACFAVLTMGIGLLGAMLLAEVGLRIFVDGKRTITYTIQRNSPQFSKTLNDLSALYYTYHGIQIFEDGAAAAVHRPDGNPVTFSFAQAKDTYRIAAVGDSITEHWSIPGYVNYTDFLASALESSLPDKNVEVMPLGVGGYNTWQEMHFFQKDFQGLSTDVLILQYCANDADVMTLRRRPRGQAVPDNEWPDYEIVGKRYGVLDQDRFRLGPLTSRAAQWLAHATSKSQSLHGCIQTAGNDEQRTALLWFRKWAQKNNTPFFVVVFPLLDDDNSQAESIYIKSLLEELGIAYLDLLPELRKHGTLEAMARDLYHPNERGHQYAAEAILRYLKEKQLLP